MALPADSQSGALNRAVRDTDAQTIYRKEIARSVIPQGDQLLAFDVTLFGCVLFEEVKRQMTERPQIGGGVPGARATPVLAQVQVQHPV